MIVILLFLAVGASRSFIAYWLGDMYKQRLNKVNSPRALIYGAGRVGREVVLASNKKNDLNIIGFIDDDPKKIFSITESAIDFIEENNTKTTPFFLQISHYAIHTNIISKEKTYNKYLNKEKSLKTDNPGLAAMNENLDEGIGIILDKIE